jgi:hypothetical protein|nr:MAG TPA: hypothetical protein [Caudoviricetes sp.]
MKSSEKRQQNKSENKISQQNLLGTYPQIITRNQQRCLRFQPLKSLKTHLIWPFSALNFFNKKLKKADKINLHILYYPSTKLLIAIFSQHDEHQTTM